MKKNIRFVATYVCDICKHHYETPQDAKACETTHFMFHVGDKVVFLTGSYGSEQGSAYPVWWPEEKKGTVLKLKPDFCLVRFFNQERLWCHNHNLYKAGHRPKERRVKHQGRRK